MIYYIPTSFETDNHENMCTAKNKSLNIFIYSFNLFEHQQ